MPFSVDPEKGNWLPEYLPNRADYIICRAKGKMKMQGSLFKKEEFQDSKTKSGSLLGMEPCGSEQGSNLGNCFCFQMESKADCE